MPFGEKDINIFKNPEVKEIESQDFSEAEWNATVIKGLKALKEEEIERFKKLEEGEKEGKGVPKTKLKSLEGRVDKIRETKENFKRGKWNRDVTKIIKFRIEKEIRGCEKELKDELKTGINIKKIGQLRRQIEENKKIKQSFGLIEEREKGVPPAGEIRKILTAAEGKKEKAEE